MAGKYTIRLMGKDALDKTAEMLSGIFNVDISTDYMDWKFFRNPAGKHLEHLAMYKERIVGIVGATPVIMKVDEIETTAALSGDLYVERSHRKAGVFLRMVREGVNYARGREVDFLFGFANDISAKVNHATGFAPVCRIDSLSLSLDITHSLEKRLKSAFLARSAAFFLNPLMRSRHSKPRLTGRDFLVKKITRFDERFDDLWEKEKSAFRITSTKTMSFLNWRYVDNPLDFEIFIVEEKNTGKLVGYTVLRIERREKKRIGRIMDCLYSRANPDVLDLLYQTIYKHFSLGKCTNINMLGCKHMHLHKYMIDRDFTANDSGFSLIVNFLGKSDEARKEMLLDPLNWHVTQGDTDHRGDA